MTIQTQLQEVLISFYKYFLEKKGIKVIDDGNMNGGGVLEEMLEALLSALLMTLVTIMIITFPDKKPQDTTKFLEEIKNHPKDAVNDFMTNHHNMLIDAVKIVKSNTSKGKELSGKDLENIAENSIVAVRDTGNFDKVINEIKDVVIDTATMVNENLSSSGEDFEFGMKIVEDDNQNFPIRRHVITPYNKYRTMPGNFPIGYIHHVVKEDSLGNLKIALENQKIDVNEKDSDKNTPLIIAAMKNDIDKCNLLIEHGADLNIADSSGNTPLFIAIENGNRQLVKAFLDHKNKEGKTIADVNHTNKEGKTAICIAKPVMAKLLKENEATDCPYVAELGDIYFNKTLKTTENPLRRKGGKSNKKRTRKQKLRRRKSLHKKR